MSVCSHNCCGLRRECLKSKFGSSSPDCSGPPCFLSANGSCSLAFLLHGLGLLVLALGASVPTTLMCAVSVDYSAIRGWFIALGPSSWTSMVEWSFFYRKPLLEAFCEGLRERFWWCDF